MCKETSVADRPIPSSSAVSARLSRQARQNTSPELRVRRELHTSGYRYRVHTPVPGKPRRTMDICFTKVKLAVFLDGCFWHGCPDHGTQPKSNAEWWRNKVAANRSRDADTNMHLGALGWAVLRFWEHEDPADVAAAIGRSVDDFRARG
ncbi:very short patch repair endonuclease [Amycolatopsis sp. WQ 127309]|uniref:very short patch repair endonuclease n=1 Tax=Amycolatopsis sp. WQ 127309 TaxID=2932773 RepID=UPI00353039E5